MVPKCQRRQKENTRTRTHTHTKAHQEQKKDPTSFQGDKIGFIQRIKYTMTTDFTTAPLEGEKQWRNAFKIVRGNDLQHRII